jgi:hypothetical protein
MAAATAEPATSGTPASTALDELLFDAALDGESEWDAIDLYSLDRKALPQ